MNPSDLYSNTLSVLTDARTAMLSSAWQTSLDGESQPVRVAAGNELIQLQGAILALSNQLLSDIAAQMQANEAGLVKCTTDLTNALKGHHEGSKRHDDRNQHTECCCEGCASALGDGLRE